MHLIHLLPVLYLGISSCQSDLCFFLMEKRDWHVSNAILVQDIYNGSIILSYK